MLCQPVCNLGKTRWTTHPYHQMGTATSGALCRNHAGDCLGGGCDVLRLASAAFAVTPNERLSDPALEAKAREITKELRCMVCQNQSIDDSDAGLAKELRVLVRERVLAGDTKDEVIDTVIGIHGEYVLLRPRWGFHRPLANRPSQETKRPAC